MIDLHYGHLARDGVSTRLRCSAPVAADESAWTFHGGREDTGSVPGVNVIR